MCFLVTAISLRNSCLSFFYDFVAKSFSWMPLSGGGELRSATQEDTRVNSLAWDERRNLLYLGGNFHAVDNTTIPPGLALWSPSEGLLPFPGGGVTLEDGEAGEVQALILDPKSRVGVDSIGLFCC